MATDAPAQISVVIPTLNEHEAVRKALESTRAPGVERIVVDGGSTDGTPEAARSLGAERVVKSVPGRARQMDAGYRAAAADVLLFLHADTRLDAGWDAAIRRALEDPRAMGGAFRLRFDAPGAVFRFLELGVRIRCRLFGLPYGDQGLFVRRKLLEALGGIPDTPIFEDIDLARAIRENGRLVMLPQAALTSARRYQRNGALRIFFRNAVALLGYTLDLDRARIAAWYRRKPAR